VRARSLSTVPALVLVAALAATVAASALTWRSVRTRQQLRLDAAAERARASIDARIEAYIAMLRGGAGFFAASDDVSAAEFHDYVSRLEIADHYPGIQGIGFSGVVTADARAAVRERMTRAGYPDFHFWRLDARGQPEPQPAGVPVHAIIYLEPLNLPNRVAMGFDMTSEPRRRAAIEAARDEGLPEATARVRLVQEIDPSDTQAGFLVYVPIYRGGPVPGSVAERRERFVGTIYSPFRADDLLSQSGSGAEVAFEVYDGDATPGNLLHRDRGFDPAARLRATRQTTVAGRRWTLVFAPGPGFPPGHVRGLTVLVALSGVLLSLVLFVVMRTEVRAREVAERAAEELRRSEETLRAVNRQKDDFLAVVSHELRTPLNAILGWASMLRHGQVAEGRREHALEIIERNAAAQARLVEDLLDTSRAIGGRLRLNLDTIDPAPVIDAVIESMRPAAAAAGLRLVAEREGSLAPVSADASRLQQIVTNLLSNSMKFTPAGGEVRIRSCVEDGLLLITVTDTGCGIAPDFLPYVFDRFRQGDSSSTRTHSGVGLGLSIVRNLVELHGGTVEARSDGTGHGATFVVTLPLAEEDTARPDESAVTTTL
jgi:signal transduction histidine kinase